MSRSKTVVVGERGFWALDDAFDVWFAYLVEQIDLEAGDDPWLASLAEPWRVAAAVNDYGADAGQPTPEQARRLLAIAATARQRAVDTGDIPVERLREWLILDDLAVSQGFSRTGDRVEVARVLEVADGFMALLDGSLPPDPATGAWFLGTGHPWSVMKMHPEALVLPRFPRDRL
ncbi:hypothetical protein [Kutzneria sp. NPDC052558]|uniref:hypothetical protein n=1 Tax=Kutzneria sp. NPDC052558 TaxID=3364121 RepID=UPI0037C514D0